MAAFVSIIMGKHNTRDDNRRADHLHVSHKGSLADLGTLDEVLYNAYMYVSLTLKSSGLGAGLPIFTFRAIPSISISTVLARLGAHLELGSIDNSVRLVQSHKRLLPVLHSFPSCFPRSECRLLLLGNHLGLLGVLSFSLVSGKS